jgi:hypothetical protein
MSFSEKKENNKSRFLFIEGKIKNKLVLIEHRVG